MKKIIFAVLIALASCSKTYEKPGILLVINHSYTTIVTDVSIDGVSKHTDIGRSKTAISVPASGTVKVTLSNAVIGDVINFVNSEGGQVNVTINAANFSTSQFMTMRDGEYEATITIQ